MSDGAETAMERAAAAGAPAGGGAGTESPEIRVTPAAAAHLRRLIEEQSIPGDERNLRIGIKTGGCSGWSYELGFDRAHPGDLSCESEGFRVVVDREAAPRLKGMVVDFVDTVQEQGFKITNPNAKSTCGCGQSFQA